MGSNQVLRQEVRSKHFSYIRDAFNKNQGGTIPSGARQLLKLATPVTPFDGRSLE